jgi:tRNA-Thr(GGU) m(6)t(6)A37 methyltransferase TsaA
MKFEFEAIGEFHSKAQKPYEAPRQSNLEESQGVINLIKGKSFEQALHDLAGFDRIWVIYCFHLNTSHWRNKVNPPRNPDGQKKGVFSTRAPYRPNPIGLSCVEIVKIKGLSIWVKNCDLLNETPILDIKPYIPYADSFPEANSGWLEDIQAHEYKVTIDPNIRPLFKTLGEMNIELETFALRHLSWQPLNRRHKRIREQTEATYTLAMQTWRVLFTIQSREVTVLSIGSSYSSEELKEKMDSYHDKEIHLKMHSLYNEFILGLP